MRVPYWHVDAFADRLFSGNQAAVMLLEEWPDDRVLQAIGAENNFAETAFVVRDAGGGADWELRWFTPTSEVALCGHATLASGHALLERDGSERATFRTRRSGVLEVRRDGECYALGLPVTRVERRADPGLLAALGCEGEVFHSVSGAEQTAVVLLPETLPQTASAVLYVWEFNIRASTVLGLVGAGGLGQELKNAVDLLDFARVLAILLVIVALVLAADRLSARLRAALL